jgi:signal transduction histidine kinase
VAAHEGRARPPSGRSGGPGGVTFRDETTALSFGRWRLRNWRLRTTLTAVLLVPLVLAGVLGVLRVTDLVREANDLAAIARQVGFAQQVGLAVHDLQGERQLVAAALATDRPADRAALQAQTQRVDAAVTMLRTADFRADSLAAAEAGAYRTAFGRLSGLPAVRQATRERNAVAPDAAAGNAITAYSDLIAALLDLDRTLVDGARGPLARQADGLNALAVAKEQASQQHAVLLAAVLSGVLPAEQQAVLRTADARFDAAAGEFSQAVPAPQLFTARAVIDRKRLLDIALDRAVRAAPLATVLGDWNAAAAGTVEAIRQGEIAQLNELRTATVAGSDRAWHRALWNGAVVAALLVVAVVTLLIVMRSLLRPLRTAAADVADRQLPKAVEQAVALSILNDTFLNLSGRNQDLVERQRQLINELRRREYDPELLSSLLQLDYLAVRMRRHSENLLVIAGGKLPHRGEERVAVLDVLRDAVSEVEQHQRVTVRRSPAAMVAGPVVNDLVRLIAELLDNAISAGATSAASQESTVTLSGTLTEDEGLLVEIIDSGPGLPPEELQVINARLASPPVVDASVSRQMGLFVVSRLAAQHGITVRLRQRLGASGISATVLLPCALVSVEPAVSVDPAANDTQPCNHGAPEAPATTEWSGTDGQLPLQVSVIDEATEADLFSPVSIGVVTSQPSSPRTAEQEWLELFGHDGSAPKREPSSDELGGGTVAASFPIPAATDPLASPLPLGTAAVAGQPQEVREEIFEMVSAWFRERQSASANSYQPGDTTELSALPNRTPSRINARRTNAHEWRSPLDEGWQAAQALRTPVDHGVTQAGLPKRQPLAHLVSGADSIDRFGPAPTPAGPVRSPDDVRGRLSRYQHGLRVGRHARIGPDEQLTITDTLQGRFEEEQ